MELLGQIINSRYQILHKISDSYFSSIYYCVDIKQQSKPVALKFLKTNKISSRIEDIIRFRSDLNLIKNLSHPNLIKIIDFGEIDELHYKLYYIAMEYFEGQPLRSYIEKNKTNFKKNLSILTTLSEVFSYLHGQGILHREIHPNNIIINSDGLLKVTDLGLSRIKDFENSQTNHYLLDKLHYRAPEQYGFFNGIIDVRTDIYSLGITFYKLLTGEVPFTGSDFKSILYQHVTKNPPSLIQKNQQIPDILEKIIFKLIEKDPVKRYQTMSGLLSDLMNLEKGLDSFQLGLNDNFQKLSFQTNILERENETKILCEMFDSAAMGNGLICFINGDAGIGKTRLAQELKEYVYKQQGLFVTGKCFSGDTKIPYGPIKDALDIYLKNFHYYSEKRKLEMKEKIKEKIGALGEIIITINPLIEEVIGPQPKLSKLPTERENDRFLMVLTQFLHIIGEIENGLVLFLDDLQWADEGTLDLINRLSQDISTTPIMILGTCRNNDLNETPNLDQIKSNLIANNQIFREINLKNFSQKGMAHFISGLLNDQSENIKDLTQQIFIKTLGNPLFTIELLKQLINHHTIFYQEKKWQVNYQTLQNIVIPETILDLLIKRISLFTENEKNILSYASIIGRKFDLTLLFSLGQELKLTYQEIVEIVDRAVELQLLEFDPHNPKKILFKHHRIKESFYNILQPQKRQELHNKVGLAIESLSLNDTHEEIYQLAYHFIEAGNNEKIIKYAVPAGITAKERYANDEAIKYLTFVKNILEQDNRVNDPLWLQVTELIGEIYLIIGQNDKAIDLFNQIFPMIQEKIKKANIYRQISQAYFKKGDWKNCEIYSQKGLNLLGEKIPISKPKVLLSIAKELFSHLLHQLFPKIFIRKKEVQNCETKKQIIWFYYGLSWAYTLSEPIKFLRTSLRMINLSERKIGPSKELGMSLTAYAGMCGVIGLYKRSLYFHNQSLEMRKKLNDHWGIGQTLQLTGFCYQWMTHFQNSINCFQESLKYFKLVGDVREVGMTIAGLVHNYYYLSDYKEIKSINHEYMEIANISNDKYALCAIYSYQNYYNYDKGNYYSIKETCQKILDISNEKKIWFMNCIANIQMGGLLFETGHFKESQKYLERAVYLHNKYRFIGQYTIHAFSRLAESYIEEHPLFELGDFKKNHQGHLKKIKRILNQSLKYAKKLKTHYAETLRVLGKYYALIGKFKKSVHYFNQAIKYSQILQRPFEEGKCYFSYGNFLSRINNRKQARENWEKAYQIFKKLGSDFYLEKTEKLLGINKTETNKKSYINLLHKKKLSEALAICKEIHKIQPIEQLYQFILSKSMEIVGASRGALFIHNQTHKKFDLVFEESSAIGNNVIYPKEILEKASRTKQPVLYQNFEKETENTELYPVSFKSILCIPICYDHLVIGICWLDNPFISGIFLEEDKEILNILFSQAIIPISKEINKTIPFSQMIDVEKIEHLLEQSKITKREKEIILLLLSNTSNKELAQKLSISPKTLTNHLTNIYQKLNVSNREEILLLLQD